jgi:hypothetical protein
LHAGIKAHEWHPTEEANLRRKTRPMAALKLKATTRLRATEIEVNKQAKNAPLTRGNAGHRDAVERR